MLNVIRRSHAPSIPRCPRLVALTTSAAVASVIVILAQSSADARIVDQDACAGTIDGAQFPELIPDGHAWRALWQAASAHKADEVARDLATGRPVAVHIQTIARRSLSRMIQVQQGDKATTALLLSQIKGRPVSDTDTAFAEASLEGRDNLIRDLTSADYKKVSAWVERNRRATTYNFGPIGMAFAADSSGHRKCQVSVNGMSRPELIPESYYWEAYFRFKALAAGDQATDVDTFSREFLMVQQRHHLPMPLADVQLLFAVASRTIAKVDALRESIAPDQRYSIDNRLRAAGLILDSRAELLRALPELSWRAVQIDANLTRIATTFDFPPTTAAKR